MIVILSEQCGFMKLTGDDNTRADQNIFDLMKFC